jgi:hypothetical protein
MESMTICTLKPLDAQACGRGESMGDSWLDILKAWDRYMYEFGGPYSTRQWRQEDNLGLFLLKCSVSLVEALPYLRCALYINLPL